MTRVELNKQKFYNFEGITNLQVVLLDLFKQCSHIKVRHIKVRRESIVSSLLDKETIAFAN